MQHLASDLRSTELSMRLTKFIVVQWVLLADSGGFSRRGAGQRAGDRMLAVFRWPRRHK
jgi:hypothetical protein